MPATGLTRPLGGDIIRPIMSTTETSHRGQFINTLREGDQVTEHYRVTRKTIRISRKGDPYLDLQLTDRTGSIGARHFGSRGDANDSVHAYADLFEEGDAIRIGGRVDTYQGKLQMIVDRIRPSLPEEVDRSLLEKSSERSLPEMEEELRECIGRIDNSHIRGLVEAVFADSGFYDRFIEAPAATRIHHAWRSGLLEHTLSLLRAASALEPVYPELEWDLVRAGLLLHDIGKTEEQGDRAGDDYTVDGTMLGHVYLGAYRVDRAIDSMPDFPDHLRTEVIHLILSHHGDREYGAPIEPASIESVFIHHLDNLDAKIAHTSQVIANDPNPQKPFTDPAAAAPMFRRYYKRVRSSSGGDD